MGAPEGPQPTSLLEEGQRHSLVVVVVVVSAGVDMAQRRAVGPVTWAGAGGPRVGGASSNEDKNIFFPELVEKPYLNYFSSPLLPHDGKLFLTVKWPHRK